MKKFFEEFRTFITRGNIVDMAVGVTVGSAFTAIVNGLTNHILKPLINKIIMLIMGGNSLENIYSFLHKPESAVVDGVLDLTQCIYIDWGAFINSVINFLIIAFVLFCIVKFFNRLKENQEKLEKAISEGKLSKQQRKELKAAGIKLTDRVRVTAYLAEKAKKEEEAKAEAEAKAKEEERLNRLANPTTEDLLKEILATIKKDA